MGRAIYKCSTCKNTFSRKSNAKRHNRDIHNEMAVIYNKGNELESNQRKAATVATSTADAIQTPTIAEDSSFYNNNNKTMAEENSQHPISTLKDFVLGGKVNSDSDKNVNNDLDKFLKFIEKLMPLVSELDTLLTSYKKPEERIKISSDTIIRSLLSSNPFNFIRDTISVHKAELGFIKASGVIALSENISPHQAKIKLKALAWNSPYFKRNQNNGVY